jgi:tetratricopeptide (TPR) repeat protein
MKRARKMAKRALQVSPDLAAAHAQLAYIYTNFNWDWPAAEAELQQALAIDPTDSAVLSVAGKLSCTLGHWIDAERRYRAVLVRDPLNIYAMWNLAHTYYRAGRFRRIRIHVSKVARARAGLWMDSSVPRKTLLAQAKPKAALAMVQQTTDMENRSCTLPSCFKPTANMSRQMKH